jgi:hypothetical protein
MRCHIVLDRDFRSVSVGRIHRGYAAHEPIPAMRFSPGSRQTFDIA